MPKRVMRMRNTGFSGTEGARDTALNWYRLAAAQGHVDACFALAEDLMVDNDFGEMPGADDLPPHPDDPISDIRKQRMINAGMAAAADGADWPAPGRARRGEDSEREEMLADYHAFAAALAALEKAMTPAQISKAQARVSGGQTKEVNE